MQNTTLNFRKQAALARATAAGPPALLGGRVLPPVSIRHLCAPVALEQQNTASGPPGSCELRSSHPLQLEWRPIILSHPNFH